jgi:molybdate transport system permease protein
MAIDWQAFLLTTQLAGLTMVILLIVATPLAWWLAHSRWRWIGWIEAVVALPLVLPPTVMGFYLLLLFAPGNGPGAWWFSITGQPLNFSFTGLVIASVIYSLPFATQPIQAAFSGVSRGVLEAGATLGASPLDRFFRLVLPLSRRGYLTAAVLVFAHTLGEFGVVLMIGGNIPGETRVVSVALYEAVETLNYGSAHTMAAILLGFSFIVLLAVYGMNRRFSFRLGPGV